jgi:hypothetical protein
MEPSGERQRMNDDRRRRFGASGRTMALLCECGDAECHRTVVLTADDYDARRPEPIVHPEHGLMPVDASSQLPPAAEIPPA